MPGAPRATIMRRIVLWLLLISSGLASGCTGRVETHSDARIRVARDASYAWIAPDAPAVAGEESRLANNPALHERIGRALDAALAAKGLRRVEDPATADFLVHYHLGIVRHREWVGDTVGGPYGPVPYVWCGHRGCRGALAWGWYGPPEVHYREVRYREGTLMFDLVERASRRIAFRAVGTKPVERDDLTDEGIRDAIDELLEDFEPEP